MIPLVLVAFVVLAPIACAWWLQRNLPRPARPARQTVDVVITADASGVHEAFRRAGFTVAEFATACRRLRDASVSSEDALAAFAERFRVMSAGAVKR